MRTPLDPNPGVRVDSRRHKCRPINGDREEKKVIEKEE
jgi:hypothetical protein